MTCPSCGLENPPSAERCDCSYEFAPRIQITKDGKLEAGRPGGPTTETKTFTYRKAFGTYMHQEGWSSKTMDDHVSEMLSAGWEVLQSHGGGGHINVGRTALRVAALGIPALILGASRAKETLTITFSRPKR